MKPTPFMRCALSFVVFAILIVAAFPGRVSAEPQKLSTIRVVWANGKTEEIPAADLNRYAVALPFPGYPPEAWPRGGAGIFELRINNDGKVSGVVITKSIGEKILDIAAMRALIQYRFKPGVFKKVYEPIVYTVARTR